jgi:hypothetical protein
MRGKLILSLAIILLVAPWFEASAAVELKPIEIIVDGKKQEVHGVMWNGGFTFVPARLVLEQLGGKFSYDPATKTLNATAPVSFSITADKEIGTLNGKPILMEIPPRLINNTFMITPGTIAQLFNIPAIYDWNTHDIKISTIPNSNNSYDPYASYNERAAYTAQFAKFGKAYLGKTIWIIGSPYITDEVNQPVKVANLTPVTIEYAAPHNYSQERFDVFVKVGDKRYIIKNVGSDNIGDVFTYNNPYEKKWPTAVYEGIKQGKIAVGMTKEMVLMSVGKPQHVNTTLQSWGTFEQWVYPTGDPFKSNYVYFKNGIVSSIQISK